MNSDSAQPFCIMMISDNRGIFEASSHSLLKFSVERSADDQPYPGNLLFLIHPLHIVPVRVASLGEACGMAVIDADNLSWGGRLKLGKQQVGRIKFKVNGRVIDIA